MDKKASTVDHRLPMRKAVCRECSVGSACIFSDLDEEEFSKLTKSMRQIHYTVGETIFHQGAPLFGCYVLCRGKTEVYSQGLTGKRVLFRVCRAGTLLEGSLLEAHAYSAGSLEVSTVTFFPRADYMDLLLKNPRVSLRVIRSLSEDRERLAGRLTAFSCKRIMGRLVKTLLDLAKEYGIEVEEGLLLDIPFSQQALADMIGSSRQTTSQCLATLAKRHAIKIRKKKVLITDVEKLKQLG